jgi:photosynthetic reaction center cytochrome c subunit
MCRALIYIRPVAILVVLFGVSFTMAAQQAPASPQVRTAEQQFKNIQVLKGTPADQVVVGMHLIEGALGVDCEYCHVANDFPNDDKEPKKTARKMIQMVRDLNQNSFSGEQVVTCYTCHHGNAKPVALLPLPDTTAVMVPYGTEPQVPALPGVDQILSKYVQALGGEQAIRKVTSRVITATRDVPTGPGGTIPMPAQMEQYWKAPNLLMTVNRTPIFSTSEGFDGSSAWAQNAMGMVNDAPTVDLARDKRNGGLYEAVTLRQEYVRMEVQGIEKVNGRDAFLVVGFPQNDSPERLYFDVITGLLLRKVTILSTPFGNSPFEVDYDDYRDSGGGVKIPFWIRMIPATPRSAMASRSSIRIQKVQDNVTVDSSKFSKPQPRAAAVQP